MSTILLCAIVIGVLFDRQYCMGVPLIREDELSEYAGETNFPAAVLQFNGIAAALDEESSTLYISQSSAHLSDFWELEGIFTSSDDSYSLFFLENDALMDIPASVSGNVPLTMIVSDGTCFQRFSVVISSLPVIRISGEYAHDDEESRAVFSGDFAMWTGYDPLTKSYSTKTSALQWHKRGNTSSLSSKNPWKLSLKDKDGKNNDLDLLGLGEDDDWILNSLTMDDTKIREKLFMDLWNGASVLPCHQYPMSTGEYTEVVMNGKYLGIFLLQRRLDAKYLDLSESDVLLKVTTYQASNVQEAYEFVSKVDNPDGIYAIMEPVYLCSDGSLLDLSNLIDTNLWLNFFAAIDNASLKNMNIVLKSGESGYRLFFIPWDTDMSLSLRWVEGVGFAFDSSYDMVYSMPSRDETTAAKAACDCYDAQAQIRWQELRQTVFSESALLGQIDDLYASLTVSGAMKRDNLLWGERYDGQDTIEHLKEFVRQKLIYMDEYYG